LEKGIVKSIHGRLLKEFMDVLAMQRMRGTELSGYDLMEYLREDFDFAVSSGTVYSVLYSMERSGLIESKMVERKRVYNLTRKGEATLEAIYAANDVIEGFFARILKGG